MKKLIISLLAAALLFTACSNTQTDTVPTDVSSEIYQEENSSEELEESKGELISTREDGKYSLYSRHSDGYQYEYILCDNTTDKLTILYSGDPYGSGIQTGFTDDGEVFVQHSTDYSLFSTDGIEMFSLGRSFAFGDLEDKNIHRRLCGATYIPTDKKYYAVYFEKEYDSASDSIGNVEGNLVYPFTYTLAVFDANGNLEKTIETDKHVESHKYVWEKVSVHKEDKDTAVFNASRGDILYEVKINIKNEKVEISDTREKKVECELKLTEILESDYRENFKRITAEQLWSMRGVFSEYDELVDGYVYGDSYIIYSIYKEQYIPYNRIYLVKEKNGYTVSDTIKNAEEWHRNLFKDSGMTMELKYIVNYSCLPNDESKSKVYNDAINAYNEFLAQQAEETLEWFNEDDQGLIRPIPFAYLKDLHGDGIPEIIVQCAIIGPFQVFSYINNTVVNIAGPKSNNMHGGCYLLENGMYASQHTTTGWFNSFVTYNSNGTETTEYFSYYGTYAYKKEISGVEIEYIEFENTQEGEQQFYDMYAPYEEALEHRMDLGESYYPFDVDTSYNYSPYVTEKLEQNG